MIGFGHIRSSPALLQETSMITLAHHLHPDLLLLAILLECIFKHIH